MKYVCLICTFFAIVSFINLVGSYEKKILKYCSDFKCESFDKQLHLIEYFMFPFIITTFFIIITLHLFRK